MGSRLAMLGLVLGAGIVALYLVTRDDWDWPRLNRRVVLGMLIAFAVSWGWIYWSSLPSTSPVSELWGIALGSSRSDVLFLKGEPAEVFAPHTWNYVASRNRTYSVVFDDADRVVRVLAFPGPGYSSGVSLLGVREGFDRSRVIELLGEPSRVVSLADGIQRAYLYDRRNAVFVLERGAVVSFGIYDAAANAPMRGASGS